MMQEIWIWHLCQCEECDLLCKFYGHANHRAVLDICVLFVDPLTFDEGEG